MQVSFFYESINFLYCLQKRIIRNYYLKCLYNISYIMIIQQ